MRSLPHLTLAFCFLLFAFVFPTKAFAVARWGPNLACYSSPQMLQKVREAYTRAGESDWIPATIIITADIDTAAVAQILTDAYQNQIVPIFRLEAIGFEALLTPDQARAAAKNIIEAVKQIGLGFPRQIYVEVGNEPNLWDYWKTGGPETRISNYNAALSAFLEAAAGGPIGVLNAALDISNPSNGNLLDAVEFWGGFPPGTLSKLNGVAFNPYHLCEKCETRFTINAWRWERDNHLVPRGAPGNPVFLLEFGLDPARSEEARRAFLESEYSSDQHPVLAITPLFKIHESNTFKIPVFGRQGDKVNVSLIDPLGNVNCGGGGKYLIAEYDQAQGGNLEVKRSVGFVDLIAGALDLFISPFQSDKFTMPELSFLSGLRTAVPGLSPYGFNLSVLADPLIGKNFNPGCNLLLGGNPIAQAEIKATENIDYDIPQNTAEDIGYLAFFQAVTTPKKGVDEQIRVVAPEELTAEEIAAANKYLSGNCPGAGGIGAAGEETLAGRGTQADILAIAREAICSIPFLAPFCQAGFVQITQVHRDKDFCPGCEILGKESMNFFNSRLPLSRALSTEDAKIANKKDVSEGEVTGPVDTVFPALGNVKTGFELLQRSLYPWRLLKGGND